MGYQTTWDNKDKSVVFQQYIAPAKKDDLFEIAKQSSFMLSTVDHTVHLVIDERPIKLTLNAADMRFLQRYAPKNQGAVVMIVLEGDMIYKKMIQSAGRAVAPKAFAQPFFVTSPEAARELLQREFGVRYP